MQGNRKILVSAILAGLGMTAASGGAHAACTLAGTWYFYDMQASSPAISTVNTSVVVNTNPLTKKNLESFKFTNTNKGYDNYTTSVIKCTMTVKASGAFTAPCVGYAPDGTNNANISGTLSLSACDLSGTINVAGDPVPVIIQGGHINGNVGAGIATQGTQFHHFTIVKK